MNNTNYTKSVAALGIMVTAAAALYGSTASSRSFVPSQMTSEDVELYMRSRLKSMSVNDVHNLARQLVSLCEKKSFVTADVLSLIATESSFRADAVSGRGAIGLMQLMPQTASYIAHREKLHYRHANDLKNPMTNITIGVHYLSYLRGRFHGNAKEYLAAYNMGPTKFRRYAKYNTPRPQAVFDYVRNIQKGTRGIRREVVRLANAQ